MKSLFTIAIILISLDANSQGIPANLEECTQLLVKTEQAGTNIQFIQIEQLMSSVNTLCLESTEFSQWANEIIYNLLNIKPKNFIIAFSKQPANIQKNILSEIMSPIHDGIDLEQLYAKIKIEKSTSSDLILDAIFQAGKKSGLTLE